MYYLSVIIIVSLLSLFAPFQSLADDNKLLAQEGIKLYDELALSNPRIASYQNALGYYHLKQGNLEEALDHFLKATQLDGTWATAHNNLGTVYLQQKQPEKAEEEFRLAIKLKPNYTKAQYNLAVALFRRKQYAEAAKAYLRACDMDRNYVQQRNNREKMKRAFEQAKRDSKLIAELKRLR
jgi:tetratricopeptide (TPR) repeat protein